MASTTLLAAPPSASLLPYLRVARHASELQTNLSWEEAGGLHHLSFSQTLAWLAIRRWGEEAGEPRAPAPALNRITHDAELHGDGRRTDRRWRLPGLLLSAWRRIGARRGIDGGADPGGDAPETRTTMMWPPPGCILGWPDSRRGARQGRRRRGAGGREDGDADPATGGGSGSRCGHAGGPTDGWILRRGLVVAVQGTVAGPDPLPGGALETVAGPLAVVPWRGAARPWFGEGGRGRLASSPTRDPMGVVSVDLANGSREGGDGCASALG